MRAAGGLAPPEVRDAFQTYLDEVRGLEPLRYEEVEPWAWARLKARVRAARAAEKKREGRAA